MDDKPKTQDRIPSSKVGHTIKIPYDVPTEPLRCTRCNDVYDEHYDGGCNGKNEDCDCEGFVGYP